MKTNAIKLQNLELNQKIQLGGKKLYNSEAGEQVDFNCQKVYASNLGFRGGKQLSVLADEYNRLISNDKISAVDSFLKIDAPAENMEALLNYILKDDAEGYRFIDSIVTQPRKIKRLSASLREKLPKTTVLFNIFAYGNPYAGAYESYLTKRYQNASSVSELLKIRPDWDEQVLVEKHKELYHNDDFELGIIPESIGKDNYHTIIDYLRSFADIGFKTKKEIPDLNIGSQVFKFENFVDGKSDKNVFKITTPNGEAFILKMAYPETRSLNNAFALGTLAKIDTYLSQNNCRNSAPIRYYHHGSNTAIYDFIEHNTADSKLNHLHEFAINMPDFADLGLSQNDTVGANNYFKLEQNQKAMYGTYDFQYGVDHNELVSVDNDHVTFDQPLSPVDYKFNKPLPCEMQMFF